MAASIEVIRADITQLAVDAIVSAANHTLLGGGGVDGAIHDAAGPRLVEECARLGGCEVGDAKVTQGYDLPARWVIHTVGPIWRGGPAGEAKALASCYRRSLEEAERLGARSVAIPAISTGAFGYPLAEAAKIAVTQTRQFLQQHESPERVLLVCFDYETEQAFAQVIKTSLRLDAPRD